jgi:hypothetical protein
MQQEADAMIDAELAATGIKQQHFFTTKFIFNLEIKQN